MILADTGIITDTETIFWITADFWTFRSEKCP